MSDTGAGRVMLNCLLQLLDGIIRERPNEVNSIWRREIDEMKQVRIYTSENCYYCDRAKVLLGKKGVAYEEIDVERNRNAMMEVVKTTGRQTVPQIFIGDFHVGGCDDLYALDAQGKLDALLGLEQ